MASLFTENIKALNARDPELACRMEALESDHSIETIKAASGSLTAFQSTPNGRMHFYHSRVDPLEEAEAWAEAAAYHEHCTFVIGMGLGYHVLSLAEGRSKIDSIHIIELNQQLFKTALETIDLSSLLAHREIHFCVGNRIEALRTIISSLRCSFTYHLYLPVLSLNCEYYETIVRLLERKLYEVRFDDSCTDERMNSHFFGKGIERLMDEIAV